MGALIITGPDDSLTKNLSQTEKNLGVDLKINDNGDLELNNLSDIKLVVGAANAAQALYLKLTYEPGSLLFHPEIGAGLEIGAKTKNALDIKVGILKSILSDSRFSDARVRVQVLGSTVISDIAVTIAGTSNSIPLKFVTTK